MNTEQSYVGKGNITPTSSPAVKNRPLTPLGGTERSALIERLNIMQGDLVDLVDNFASIGSDVDPIAFLVDMLQNLLTQPGEQFASQLTRTELRKGLMMIAFFDDLQRQLDRREGVLDKLEFGKEVQDGN